MGTPPFIILIILVLWSSGAEGFLKKYDFRDKVLIPCSHHRDSAIGINERDTREGREYFIPNTIETFIGIVDKLEQLHPSWNPAYLIKTLLLNFRYDDAEVQGNAVSTRGNQRGITPYYEALIKLFKDPSTGQQLREDDLTLDERCALYYMISHTVNYTLRAGEQEVIEQEGTQIPLYLREQGLVTLSSQSEHAFALGKVLLGLLAGLERSDPVSGSQIYKEVKNQADEELETSDAIISVLYAATFGDIVSVAREELGDKDPMNVESLFFENGHWDATVCPLHYFLSSTPLKHHHGSYSLIRGATDGYRLGSEIKNIMNGNPKLRLSQVLRTYYSGNGFPSNKALSWCTRRELELDKLKEEAFNYEKLHSALIDRSTDDNTKRQDVDKILKYIFERSSKIYDESTREGKVCGSISLSGSQCETPTHVIAVLDTKAREERELQSIVIGNLSSGMQFGGLLGSAASVFTNLKPYGGGFELDSAFSNRSFSGCAGCAAKYYNPQRANYEAEAEVFRDLNRTLGNLRKGRENDPGIPAQVVLYFNYGSPARETQLQTAIREFRLKHRGTKLLAFGSRKESLQMFADDEDIETNIDMLKIDKLIEKVCKVPAQFQYSNCYLHDDASERSSVFEGVVSSRRVQYWMMHPKYFLKSFNIKLFFKALSGEIRVCYSRQYSRIFNYKEPNGANCQKSSNGEDITFDVSNPCHKHTEESCDPFYFYIEGKTPPKENEPCQHPACQTLDQITYEFRHEGISCNAAVVLMSNKFLTLLWLAVTVWVLRVV